MKRILFIGLLLIAGLFCSGQSGIKLPNQIVNQIANGDTLQWRVRGALGDMPLIMTDREGIGMGNLYGNTAGFGVRIYGTLGIDWMLTVDNNAYFYNNTYLGTILGSDTARVRGYFMTDGNNYLGDGAADTTFISDIEVIGATADSNYIYSSRGDLYITHEYDAVSPKNLETRLILGDSTIVLGNGINEDLRWNIPSGWVFDGRLTNTGNMYFGNGTDTLFFNGTDTVTDIIDLDTYNYTSIGIGRASNTTFQLLDIYNPAVISTGIQIQNGTTGALTTDGGTITMSTTGTLNITNKEAADMNLSTDGGTWLTLANDGSHTGTGQLHMSYTSTTLAPLWSDNTSVSGEGGPGGVTKKSSAVTNTNVISKFCHAFEKTSSGTTTTGFGSYNLYRLKTGTSASTSMVVNGWSWNGTAANYYPRMYWGLYKLGTLDTALVIDYTGVYFGQTKTGSYVYADSAFYNGGAASKMLSKSILDDGIIIVPAGKSGLGWAEIENAGTIVEHAYFLFNSDGSVTLITNSANAVTTDTDTKFCIFDGGTSVYIRNRLGGTRTIKVKLMY